MAEPHCSKQVRLTAFWGGVILDGLHRARNLGRALRVELTPPAQDKEPTT